MSNLLNFTATGRDAGGAYFTIDGIRFYFFDAEKTSKKSDDSFCWAASAANMLARSKWGYTVTIKNEDQIFDVFRKNFSGKSGGYHFSGIQWYLTGNYDQQGRANIDQLKNKKYQGLFPGLNVSQYTMVANATPRNVGALQNYLVNGGSVGLVISFYDSYFQFKGGHALTAWMLDIDNSKPEDDPARIRGIYVSDPDDDRTVNGGGAKAPDRLVYLPLAWQSYLGSYEISGAYNPGYRITLNNLVLLNSKPDRLAAQSDLKVKAGASARVAAAGTIAGNAGTGVRQFSDRKNVKLSFSIINGGWNDSQSGSFDILIDGGYFAGVAVDALRPGSSRKFQNLNLGKLEAGSYRLEIVVNNSGSFDEVTRHNNREVIEITVSSGKTPDLAFVDGAPMVFGLESLGETPLTDSEAWGIFFTVGNAGAAKSGTAQVEVIVDGVSFGSYSVKSLGKGKSRDYFLTAPEFSALSVGTHLLELEIRPHGGTADARLENNRASAYFYVNSDAVATDIPISRREEDGGEQTPVFLNSTQAVSITGAFAAADDVDEYVFHLQDPDQPAVIEIVFSGTAGKIYLTDDDGRRELSQGYSRVSVQGNFSITLGDGVSSDSGDYFLLVSPPGRELSGSAPELVLSTDVAVLDSGESLDLYFQPAWDPGREIEFTLNVLYGEEEQLSFSGNVFRFDSANWFERQKLTISVKDDSYRDSLGLQLAADGVEAQMIYLDIADKSNNATPIVTALTEAGGELEIRWIANTSILETVEIQRRVAGGEWESVAFRPAGDQVCRLGDFDTARGYEYRLSGVNSYNVVSPWSEPVEFDGFTTPAAADSPVFFSVPEVAVFGHNAELCWQQAGDQVRIAGYEIRFAATVDGLTGDGFYHTARSYTWKNLALGDYFVQLRAVNHAGLKSDWTDIYTFAVDYEAPEEAGDRLAEATMIALGATHSESVGGDDPADYLQLTLNAGRYSFAGLCEGGDVRISVYDIFGKKMLSASGRSGGGFAAGEKLLAAGSYFVEVTATGRSGAAGSYSFTFDGVESRTGDLTNQLPGTATVIDLEDGASVFSADFERGFVGFSDPVDFYRFTLDRVGTFNVRLDGLDGKVKLSIGQLDAAGNFKVLKTVTGGNGQGVFNLNVKNGDYYIRVTSLSAGSDRSDTAYSLRLDGSRLDGAADNSNDNWKNAHTLETGVAIEDWVGRGDSIDYFRFTLESAGAVKLDFTALSADSTAAAATHVALYDAKKRRLTVDETGFTNVLAAGSYYAVVSIDSPKQYNSRYELGILLA